jgi:mono/diheme cytochrome c family protein
MRSRLCLYLSLFALGVRLSGELQGQSDTFQSAPPESAGLKNPFNGDSDHARAGAKLFRRSCASCHGADATGKGKYPNLRTEKIRQTPPGALFWFLRTGAAKEGMPSFNRLPKERIWQIITFLQAEPAPAH